MIKRVIGVVAVLVSLVVMVSVALHRDRFSSMVFDEQPVAAVPEEPATEPEENLEMSDDTPVTDSVRLAE